MSDNGHNPDRVRRQVDKMRMLEGRDRRVTLLRSFAARRTQRRVEGDGLQRVPMRLADPRPDRNVDLDPVLIVPDEILVPADQRGQAERVLRSRRFLAPDAGPGARPGHGGRNNRGEPTSLLRLDRKVDVLEALHVLRDAGIRAGAQHVAALGGRAKGGNTPMPTAADLGTRPSDEVAAHPLVVVIDTGIDRAAIDGSVAGHRTDRWLSGVTADSQLNGGVDLLDTNDHDGTGVADGYLDLGAGHGTFVAGLIRQSAPSANIVMIRALDTDGHGSEQMVEDAIDRANDLFTAAGGPGLLNLSLGLETVDGLPPVGISRAIDDLPDTVRVVAAAGNGATGIPVWPAALDLIADPAGDQAIANRSVLGVASVERNEAANLVGSEWSNSGQWVDFSALGEDVSSTFVAGEETKGTGAPDDPFDPQPETFPAPNPYAAWSGTSFATAKVTGELARYLIDHGGDPSVTVGDAVDDLAGRGMSLAGFGLALDI
jgi:Subtilase family